MSPTILRSTGRAILFPQFGLTITVFFGIKWLVNINHTGVLVMETLFASCTEAEIRVYQNDGLFLTFVIDANVKNVRRYLRCIGSGYIGRYRMDEPVERPPKHIFLEVRRFAVDAIETKRLIERSELNILEADLGKRIICVDVSWDEKFALITFGACRENHLYLKACEGSFVPQGLCDHAREIAEKEFANAIVDTTHLPLLEHAMARKT